MPDTYPISEIYQTIQGEAGFTGTPCVMIRFQGCPIGCPWCDTKYTWEVERAREFLTVDDILNRLEGCEARHIVITGGEPCLHDLKPLTRALEAVGLWVQVETSGVYPILASLGTWVTVSPKIDMPGGTCRRDALDRANEIKLPVGKQRDIDRLIALLGREWERTPQECQIWLQPLSASREATQLCIETATRLNWRVSVQVHKLLGLP